MKKLFFALVCTLILLLCACGNTEISGSQKLQSLAQDYMIEYISAKEGDTLVEIPEISIDAVDPMGSNSFLLTGTASIVTTENSNAAIFFFSLTATEIPDSIEYIFEDVEIVSQQ